MDDECALHNSIVMAICMPKIIKFGGDLTKFSQKQVGSFFDTPCTIICGLLPRQSSEFIDTLR